MPRRSSGLPRLREDLSRLRGSLKLPWGRSGSDDDPYWDAFINRPPSDIRNAITEIVGKAVEGNIFPTLTVRQNLALGLKDPRKPGKWKEEDMFAMFSNLANRADTAAGVLSGGEKQMLTICRTLMGDPELIMIDEPTEGLAPLIVQQVGDLIAEIAKRGVAILLVEQKLSIAMRISHRLYVMGHGRIVFEGTPADLKANQTVRKEWLEV